MVKRQEQEFREREEAWKVELGQLRELHGRV